MGTSSGLNAHEENSISATPWGPRHIVRFHLPLFTNPAARMFLDGESFHFEEGSLFFFHHGCVHAANNPGDQPRYHFVLDCFLNRRLFADIIDPNSPNSDAGLHKLRGDDRVVCSESFYFPNFVREGGQVVTGSIDYGRRAPALLDHYRRNYPSVFGQP